MRDNFVEAIKQQHDDTWMEKDGLVKKIDRGGSHQEILERAKGIEQRSPGAAKDLNIGS